MKKLSITLQYLSFQYHRLLTYLFGAPEFETNDEFLEIMKESFPKFYNKHLKS